jgi:3-methyladenine DNA glycosylase AlkD
MPALRTAVEALTQLQSLADPIIAAGHQKYFQTGPGGYAEGDRFLGLRVPTIRQISREIATFSDGELQTLLCSEWHEARLLALHAMVRAYQRGAAARHDQLHAMYLQHTRWINNWDLVDSSAEHLVGAHVYAGRARAGLLNDLQRSDLLWERRIAILATFHFIKQRNFAVPLQILAGTLPDKHPLIHKAAGWMLREIGKRDRGALETFLQAHARVMPRTMLRYAIERFSPQERAAYMRR